MDLLVSFGYLGLFVAVAIEWIAIAGPGQAALVSGGILAQRGKLDLSLVLLVTVAATLVGGVIGFWVGHKAGRGLMLMPGPLRERRERMLVRAERTLQGHGFLTAAIAPGWLSGMNGIELRLFVIANSLSGVLWSVGIGVGAYLIGPAVVDVVNDVGTWGVVAIVAALVLVYAYRRIRSARPARPGSRS